MKKSLLFIFAVSAISLTLFVSSCKKDSTTEDTPEETPTPTPTPSYAVNFLKLNNQWVYENTLYGTVIPPAKTMTVKQDLGNGVFKITMASTYNYSGYSETITDSSKLAVDADYLYLYDEYSSVDKYKYLSKSPTLGEQFTHSDGGISITYTVDAINENVTVPAGTFSCTKIKETMGTNISYTYINKDYGLINILQGSSTIMQLKSKNF